MRAIVHPGPAHREALVQPVRLRAHALDLPAGASLLDAVDLAVRARCGAAASGVLHLRGGRCEPFPYVLPALSRSPEHAVYFSDRHEADGAVELVEATATLGRRADGRPWLHSHVDWIEADGRPGCGHVLPDQARLSRPPAQATFWQMLGAHYAVQADEETRFSLFKPVAMPEMPVADDVSGDQATAGSADTAALALRLGPNLDVCETLEAICAAHGFKRAVVRGGVGSTVGAVFDDGRVVEPFVTETLIRSGRIEPDAQGRLRAAIDVTMIDFHGARHQGRLSRGQNPVLVTFELVLAASTA